MQTIRDIMTTDVHTVTPDTSIAEAARMMRDQGIGDVLVSDGSNVTGIVTDRDITIRATADGGDPNNVKVADVCSGELTTVGPDEDVSRAATLMRENAVRRLPVVENGKPVGVVSIGDLAIERDEESALADISAAPANE